ncbi:MAG: MFS transporter, partial [Candidatus Odinarchaeota archaeon]
MLYHKLERFFEINDLSKPAKKLIWKFFLLDSLNDGIFYLSSTFYVLYVLDTLGYFALAALVAWAMIVQAFLDYPTGAVGDWIGQRWVLFLAYISFSISFGLLSISDTFIQIFTVYTLFAFAQAQASGTLQSWFDNNYKVCAEDPKREIYMAYVGKATMVYQYIMAVIFISGGFLADLLSRQTVFAMQALVCFLTAIILVVFVTDLPGIIRPQRSIKKYIGLLKEGVVTVYRTRELALLTIGFMITSAAATVWARILLMPFYFSYTLSDSGTSLLRFIIWITQSIWMGKAGVWSKTLEYKEWFPRFQVLQYIILFVGVIAIVTILPASSMVSLFSLCIIIIFFFFFGLFKAFASLLWSRTLLDMVPSRNRNSIYSLFPTLAQISSAILIVFTGFVITASLTFSLFILLLIALFGCLFYFRAFRERNVESISILD